MVGVINDVRSERLEAQPAWLPLASLVHEPDATRLAAALDPAGHVVVRQVTCQALLQLIGLARIEALPDERAQIVAQRLCQLLFGWARNVCILDDVPRIDIVIVVVSPGLLLPAHGEEHPRLSVRVHDAAHGYDVAGPLGLDARGEFVEALLVERSSCRACGSPVEDPD